MKVFRIYKNKIKKIDLTTFEQITLLKINNNDITELDFLPPTLEHLVADRNAVINYDFKGMVRLKKLGIKLG